MIRQTFHFPSVRLDVHCPDQKGSRDKSQSRRRERGDRRVPQKNKEEPTRSGKDDRYHGEPPSAGTKPRQEKITEEIPDR